MGCSGGDRCRDTRDRGRGRHVVARRATSWQSGPAATAAAAGLMTRKLSVPEAVWPFSNPSDDGRFLAGMVTATGDAAIVDLATGRLSRARNGARRLKAMAMLRWASLSPDGTTVAVDWHHRPRRQSLRLARADGSRPRLLIDAPGDV